MSNPKRCAKCAKEAEVHWCGFCQSCLCDDHFGDGNDPLNLCETCIEIIGCMEIGENT